MVEVGVRYDSCVQFFQVKFISIESWIRRCRVLGSWVDPAVKQDAAGSCLDEHGSSSYLVESSESYESNVACFAKCRPKDPLADITENPAALFAFGVKVVSGACNDLGVWRRRSKYSWPPSCLLYNL